jgi:DNA-binding protein Fis
MIPNTFYSFCKDRDWGFPTLKEVEVYVIEETLRLPKGNQGIAASLLDMKRQTLNRRLIRKKQK